MSFSISSYINRAVLHEDIEEGCSYVIDVPKEYSAKTHDIIKIGGRYLVRRKCMLPDELFEVE